MFFYGCFLFYFIAAALYIAYLFKKRPAFFEYSKQWLSVGFIAGLFFLIVRYREQAYLPLVSLFEITFFWAWLLTGVYVLLIKETTARIIQGVALIIFNGIFLADLFLDTRSHPLNPLLNSPWLGIHVPSIILSYSAFALSFAVSLYIMIASKNGKPTSHLDSLNLKLIIFGAILLGFGIVTGSIWAHKAWGTYWSWDPKETWALITFIIYASAVTVPKIFRLKSFWQAGASVAGFLSMLITFFGVSLMMASHHAYHVVK